MTFEAWLDQIPPSIKNDPLWNFQVYPKALFLSDLVWEDCEKLMKGIRGRKIAAQLISSACQLAQILRKGMEEGLVKIMPDS